MQLPEAVNISKQIEQDLIKYQGDPKVSQQIINGTGFRQLYFGSDFLPALIPKANLTYFLADYLKTMNLKPEIKAKLASFCDLLPDVQKLQWKKFQCLYEDSNFKGSWIGVYYREREDGQCQFISNAMSCSFKLMPDVYVLRTEQSGGFLMFNNKKTDIVIVERERGLTRQDYLSVMNVCRSIGNTQYALK